MATVLTDIFNAAFGALGDDHTIQDAETASDKKSSLARLRWPFVRDALLRSHPWNCASFRTSLSPNQTGPDWGYTYAYTLPTDPYCLRVLRIESSGMDFQIEGRTIVTDDSALSILYVGRIDPAQFDAQLADCAIDILASELALPLLGTNGANFKKSLYESVYGPGGKLPMARTVDGQEGRSQRSRVSPFVDIRDGGSGVAGPFEWINK